MAPPTTAVLKCAILTEASATVGWGHLTRCVALYDALEHTHVACELIVAGDAPAEIIGPRHATQTDWRDPTVTSTLMRGRDIAVVDSYVAGVEVYQIVADSVAVRAYLDDTARLEYPPGFVINGRPTPAESQNGQTGPTTRLEGSEYQVLRREFVLGNRDRRIRSSVERVMVLGGGGRSHEILGEMTAAVRDMYPQAEIDVVESARSACELRDSMLAADLAVTAGGQTIYELACLGTPAIAVCVADNQIAQVSSFVSHGALLAAGKWGDEGLSARLRAALAVMGEATPRQAMSAAGRNLVDGRGAARIASVLVSAAYDCRVKLRRATRQDESALFELANDSCVRLASWGRDEIGRDEHHDWLGRVLEDPHRLLLVAHDDDRLVGQVRFDVGGSTATVSLALSAAYRRIGLSSRLLFRAERMLSREYPGVDSITAQVRASNASSRALFDRSGYSLVESPSNATSTGIAYKKDLRCPA